MAISTKIIIGCTTSIAGVSSAVAVPLTTMNTQNNSDSIDKKMTELEIDLTQCSQGESENLQEVSYGVKNIKNICGKLKRGERENLEQISENYINLLKEKGNEDNNSEESGTTDKTGRGSVQCRNGNDSHTSGIVPRSEAGNKYLGLCEKLRLEETKFVKRENEQLSEANATALKIGICNSNCWSSDRQTENSNSGKQITFYNRENLRSSPN